MDDRRPNFAEIKRRVTMLDVLRRYDIQLRAVNQTSWAGKCPLPQHTSEDRETFKVTHGKRGWGWACHSASCIAARNTDKKGGDLIEFVKFMEQLSGLRAAGVLLENRFGSGEASPAAPTVPQSQKVDAVEMDAEAAVNPPLAFTLQGVQHVHPYLEVRGFDEEECEYLGVGFFPGRGMFRNRIVFPLHNESGQLIGYAGRRVEYSLHDDDPTHIAPDCPNLERWLFPPNFKRGQVLYNVHRVTEDDWTEVIVFESFWSVLAAVRAGIMNAVAIMSNYATAAQIQMLSQFSEVTICFDGDKPGREGAHNLLESLSATDVSLALCVLKEGEQPDSLTPDALRKRLGIPPVPDGSLEVVEDHPHLRAVPA